MVACYQVHSLQDQLALARISVASGKVGCLFIKGITGLCYLDVALKTT